jgi:8-oxo-dGTP diphosphatase
MKEVILTVDLAATINGSEIVLIKRTKPPFMDKLVLPGGHFEQTDKSAAQACAREAMEEIGLRIDPENLKLLMILDGPDRDPRPGRRVSVVYTIDLPNREAIKNCRASSDAHSINIKKIDTLKEDDIGFDHWEVIKKLKI